MFDSVRRRLPFLFGPAGPVVPVLRLSGPIGLRTPFSPTLTATGLSRAVKAAFSFADAPAVALVINSPGGSAVQSHLIHRRIRQLAEEKEKPVIAFVEDAAASGGYMLACAADEIYADPSSIVGSIGVVSRGFGFVGLMDKLGVERRLYAAGESKAMLDPFRPEQEPEVAHLKQLQSDVHRDFIELVKERRGERLAAERDDLFGGLFWSGRTAQELGLIDGLGDLHGIMRERFGKDVALRPVPLSRGGILQRFFRGPRMGIVEQTAAMLEEQALWARYGL